jgi:hypothetical protein
MSLPKLQVSKYNTIIPSTGKRAQFRAFLVKEEKILLMAQESGESEQVVQALKDVVAACTFEKLDVDTLTSYDLEHLFIQIRMKSVGETIDLQVKCPNEECLQINQIVIDLNDVGVSAPATENPPSSKVELDGEVGVILRAIPVADMDAVSDKTEDFTRMIGLCIESVYDATKVYPRKDISDDEMEEFVAGMNHEQLMKIEAFIANQPRLTFEKKIKCHACGGDISIKLAGLQDFFQ